MSTFFVDLDDFPDIPNLFEGTSENKPHDSKGRRKSKSKPRPPSSRGVHRHSSTRRSSGRSAITTRKTGSSKKTESITKDASLFGSLEQRKAATRKSRRPARERSVKEPSTKTEESGELKEQRAKSSRRSIKEATHHVETGIERKVSFSSKEPSRRRSGRRVSSQGSSTSARPILEHEKEITQLNNSLCKVDGGVKRNLSSSSNCQRQRKVSALDFKAFTTERVSPAEQVAVPQVTFDSQMTPQGPMRTRPIVPIGDFFSKRNIPTNENGQIDCFDLDAKSLNSNGRERRDETGFRHKMNRLLQAT